MTKRALLVGCNYPGSQCPLRGCINDVTTIKALIKEFYGFSDENITVLIDTDSNYEKPTGAAIKKTLSKLVAESQDGDVLLFHFSGHGTQAPCVRGDEADKKDEAICPTDMNLMIDDDLKAILAPISDKVQLTVITDCCHSGGMLDHKEVVIEGLKPGQTPPPSAQLPIGALLGAFGLKDLPEGLAKHVVPPGEDGAFVNRGLPENKLLAMLSQIAGGEVTPSNLKQSLVGLFGNDASRGAVNYVQILDQVLAKTGMANADERSTPGMVVKMLRMVAGCLSKPNTVEGGPQPGGEPDFSNAVVSNGGGAQPPAPHMAEDKGVLITGCMANETSADACPSGDGNQAYGALTNAINTVVRAHYQQFPGRPLTYRDVVTQVRDLLGKTGFAQNPCLECAAHLADQPFICGV